MTNNELHDAALFSFGMGVGEVLLALGRDPNREQVKSVVEAAIQSASSLAAAFFKFDPVNDRDRVKFIGDKLTNDLFMFFDREISARNQVN